MQKWKKIGRVFCPNGEISWMASHAMMPCVSKRSDGLLDVYFSPRDKLSRSRPARLTLELENESFKVVEVLDTPLLELGETGSFDDAGVMPTCLYSVQGQLYMAFNGWCLGKSVPFYSFNGYAKQHDNNQFRKMDKFPNLLNRSTDNPFSTFAPFILKDNNEYKMWYVSLIKWDGDKHYYNIRFSRSDDGFNWVNSKNVSIDFTSQFEYAIARPMVIKENGVYKMWYSRRASEGIDTYRIGYAESSDGESWNRMDSKLAFDVASEGWDSEMVCYAYIFDHNGSRYMAYNGNGYGKTGFGLAILEK